MNLADFHLLRPEWLLALLPLGLLLLAVNRSRGATNQWSRIIPPELLQHLMPAQPKTGTWPTAAFASLWLLAVLALAGPAWEKQPQPVQSKSDYLVVILDLSLSTLATDLQPNRLTRAKQKLSDLLEQRREGNTALVVYAGDSHVVAPLTDDAATVASMVPALDPFIMPALGSRPQRAVQQAIELLQNASVQRGQILLLTDDMTDTQAAQIKTLLAATPFSLSIISIGTPSGGPIAIPDRGFLQDSRGQVVIPKVDVHLLRELAQATGGQYEGITLDDRDLEITVTSSAPAADFEAQDQSLNFDLWQDEGYWLVLLLLPLALWLHRRGALVMLFLMLSLPPQQSEAFEWRDLWKTPDQQAQEAYRSGEHDTAAELFENRPWKGSALYRLQDFEGAAQAFEALGTAEGHFNQGNSFAHLGKYDEALKAYDKALELEPDFAAAKANRAVVEKIKQLQEQKQQEQKQQNKDNRENSDQQQQDEQQSADQQQSNQGSEQEPSEGDPSQASQNEQDAPQQDSQEKQQQDQNRESDQNQKQEPNRQEQPQEAEQEPAENKPDESASEAEEQAETSSDDPVDEEQKQEFEQWLRRVPDDPGGLLRRKFEMQYRERGFQEREPTDQPIW